jgi:F0F1-type ATP synthase delta subunit
MTSQHITIISAVEIDQSQKSILELKLRSKHPTKADFIYKIDPTLLAGLIVKVDDVEYHHDLRDQIDFILLELLK